MKPELIPIAFCHATNSSYAYRLLEHRPVYFFQLPTCTNTVFLVSIGELLLQFAEQSFNGATASIAKYSISTPAR